MLIAMLGVLGILVVGILSMVKGGAYREKYGNKLMQARVMLQGLVIAMLALGFLVNG